MGGSGLVLKDHRRNIDLQLNIGTMFRHLINTWLERFYVSGIRLTAAGIVMVADLEQSPDKAVKQG